MRNIQEKMNHDKCHAMEQGEQLMAPSAIVQEKVASGNNEKSGKDANPMLALLGLKPKALKNEDVLEEDKA